MKIPVTLRLVLLMVGATLFYAYVGQLVPQKEVHPPEVVELAEDLTPEQMAEIGQEIFIGKGMCATCHTIGKSGALRFPDLDGIATRAATRIPGFSALDYLAQSLYEPDVYIVDGFNPGMPAIDKPPVALTDGEILTVIAYLQSLGGTPTLTPSAQLAWGEGGDGAAPGDGATTVSAEPIDAGGPAAGAEAAAGLAAADDPLSRFGCAECHAISGTERLEATSLADAGERFDREQLAYRVAFHESNEGAAPLPALSVDELRLIVDRLAALRGGTE